MKEWGIGMIEEIKGLRKEIKVLEKEWNNNPKQDELEELYELEENDGVNEAIDRLELELEELRVDMGLNRLYDKLEELENELVKKVVGEMENLSTLFKTDNVVQRRELIDVFLK